MQLRKTKSLGAFDHHDTGVGNIHPDLNHRGGHEDLGLPLGEALHLPSLVVRLHSPMDNGHLIVGDGEAANDALVTIHQVLVVECGAFLDEGIDQINLAAFGNLVLQKLKDFEP